MAHGGWRGPTCAPSMRWAQELAVSTHATPIAGLARARPLNHARVASHNTMSLGFDRLFSNCVELFCYFWNFFKDLLDIFMFKGLHKE